jgi:tetratricopeptide (TPR) repeat protein
LPLALHPAGSYLARYRRSLTVDNYLAQLRDAALIEHHSLQTGGVSPTGHEQNVSRTIALSFNRLDRADPSDNLALALLARAACLAPGEPIPYPLLLLTLNTADAATPHSTLHTPYSAEGAVNRLAELGLLRSTTPDVVQLHRLVLAFVQNALVLELPTARTVVERALGREAERLNEAGYPAALLAWQAHLRTVTLAAFDRDDEQAARLCHALGEHFRQIGDYARAQVCMERVVAIRQKVFGEEHEVTARSLTDLGEILELQDKGELARACLGQALAIQEKVLGDHPDTATTLSHLGYHLHNRGYLDEARPYHERALAIRRKVLGEEHPLVAFTLCHLAYIEYRKENHAASRTNLEQALAIQKKTLGEEHPEIARTFQNIGELLMVGQSDLASAQQAFEQALTIQQKVLAKEHPENARLFNNLGELHYNLGNMVEAKLYLEAALVIRQKMLGEEHVDTAIIFYDMGRVSQAQGDLTGARQLYLRALKTFNARLNADHYLIRFTQTYLESLDST